MTSNARWLPAAVALVAAGVVAASFWLLSLGIGVLVAGAVAWAWAQLALVRIDYRRELATPRVFAGDEVELRIALVNDKPIPLAWLRVEDEVPRQVGFPDASLAPTSHPERRVLAHAVSLGPYERITWRYRLRCPRRGHYLFGPLRLTSGDIFGLYHVARAEPRPLRLVVFPRTHALAELGFPPGDPFGGRRMRQLVAPDPLRVAGVRDYRPEDSLRHVHWKAAARDPGHVLKVKVLESVSQPTLVLVVNSATFAEAWLGIDPDLQEKVITTAASIARHAAGSGYAVGLAVNGSVPGTGGLIEVPASRSVTALPAVLEGLAAITAFTRCPIESTLARASHRAPWGATLVVVSAVVGDRLGAEMLRLRRVGRRCVLVGLDPQRRDVWPGVTTYHLNSGAVGFAPEAW